MGPFGSYLKQILLHDPKGPASGVRALTEKEVWRLHGGTDEEWAKAVVEEQDKGPLGSQ